mmetsp:Transcript_28741/g.66285  ORF Transcript_28741/g.66285 Transcript_28741/m.66285 type:complete len:206 (-) Transcript_28741:3559-4176(-)
MSLLALLVRVPTLRVFSFSRSLSFSVLAGFGLFSTKLISSRSSLDLLASLRKAALPRSRGLLASLASLLPFVSLLLLVLPSLSSTRARFSGAAPSASPAGLLAGGAALKVGASLCGSVPTLPPPSVVCSSAFLGAFVPVFVVRLPTLASGLRVSPVSTQCEEWLFILTMSELAKVLRSDSSLSPSMPSMDRSMPSAHFSVIGHVV